MKNTGPQFATPPAALFRRTVLATAFTALAGLSVPGQAIQLEHSLKLKLGAQAESDPVLGATDEESTEAYAELSPTLRLQFTPNLSAYVRAQGFLPSGEISSEEDERTVRSQGYVALREAWVEYGGLTSYPGEVLRVGLQRVRQADGQWLDRDIESVRWIFDTTLVQAQLGVAQQFSTWRSDDIELSNSQKDRGYAYGDIGGQWRPGHFLGLRTVYAQDQDNPPQVGSLPEPEDKLAQRRYGWLGLRAENGYFDHQRKDPLSYWAELSLLWGDRETAELATDPGPLPPPGTPAAGAVMAVDEDNVSGQAFDLGLRARLGSEWPLVIGAAYAAGSVEFEQTGLQSNRSRFTGTRSLVHRYNEAYRAELGNLQVATAFLAFPGDRYDTSLVYSQFRRDDENAPVISHGLTVAPSVASRDLGHGVDLVLTRYFADFGGLSSYDDDLRSNLRLRASMFQPGEAYGQDTEEFYRVMLEATLWF